MSVIIIGNGPSVLDKELGKKIDSFDTVVRLNNYTTKGYEKYIGSKTAIWGRSDAKDIVNRDISSFQKVIVFIPPQNYTKEKRLKGIRNLLFQENVELCDIEISMKSKKLLKCSRGEWPSTGMLAVNYFILNRYKDIYIHGFDCFSADKKLRHYYDNKISRMKGHNPKKEKLFLMKMKNEAKIIKVLYGKIR